MRRVVFIFEFNYFKFDQVGLCMVLSCVEKEMKERKIDKTDIGYLCRLSMLVLFEGLITKKVFVVFSLKLNLKFSQCFSTDPSCFIHFVKFNKT